MSYFEKTQIQASDGPSIDAFGRWRVSEPTTLFDSKLIHGSGSTTWATKIVGNATASYNQDSASVYLTVSNISGSRATRQTKKHFNYQPGKSTLIILTAVFDGSVSSVTKTIGYYDVENGLYFQQSGSSFGVGIRTTSTTGVPVDTFTSQSSWNLDTFDGTGASGKTLDLDKAQIFFMDFEWLGVGRVRYGIFQGGNAYYVHQLDHINALTGVYMSTPNLPLREEIIQYGTGGRATLQQICGTVISEGGVHETGIASCINTGIAPISVATGAERVLLAVRKMVTMKGVNFVPRGVSVATPDTNDGRWSLWINPTPNTALTWGEISGSNLEFAVGTTQTLTGGQLVASGYLIGGTVQAAGAVAAGGIPYFQGIGFDLDDNAETLVLSVQSIGGTNGYFAAMDLQVES